MKQKRGKKKGHFVHNSMAGRPMSVCTYMCIHIHTYMYTHYLVLHTPCGHSFKPLPFPQKIIFGADFVSVFPLSQFASDDVKTQKLFSCHRSGSIYTRIPIFVCFCHTCIHAIVSRNPWGHGWVAPDKRQRQRWTKSPYSFQ